MGGRFLTAVCGAGMMYACTTQNWLAAVGFLGMTIWFMIEGDDLL